MRADNHADMKGRGCQTFSPEESVNVGSEPCRLIKFATRSRGREPPMLLIMAMIAGVVAPAPTGFWITHGDYPASSLQRGEEGATAYRAVIAPNGKPESCEVLSSTGNETFNRLTCSLLMRRARFSPAKNETGSPAYGVFHSVTNFWLPNSSKSKIPLILPPNLRLTVKALPTNVQSPVVVTVHVGVDELGAFRTCSVSPTQQQAKLASVACAQIPQHWEDAPVKNTAGLPVAYVRTFIVSFEVE